MYTLHVDFPHRYVCGREAHQFHSQWRLRRPSSQSPTGSSHAASIAALQMTILNWKQSTPSTSAIGVIRRFLRRGALSCSFAPFGANRSTKGPRATREEWIPSCFAPPSFGPLLNRKGTLFPFYCFPDVSFFDPFSFLFLFFYLLFLASWKEFVLWFLSVEQHSDKLSDQRRRLERRIYGLSCNPQSNMKCKYQKNTATNIGGQSSASSHVIRELELM